MLNLDRSLLQTKSDANVQGHDSSKAIFIYRKKNGDSKAVGTNLTKFEREGKVNIDAIDSSKQK